MSKHTLTPKFSKPLIIGLPQPGLKHILAGVAIVLGTGQITHAKGTELLDFSLAESPYAKQTIARAQASPAAASSRQQSSTPANHRPIYTAPGLDQAAKAAPQQPSTTEWLPAYQPSSSQAEPAAATSKTNPDVALSFEPSPSPWQTQPSTPDSESTTSLFKRAFVGYDLADLFVGDTDSLVAKAVGAAEGTRTPEGFRTPAYYGHVDPGNGAWNLGTFSFQHGATSPEEADQRQLARLKQQAELLSQKAMAKGMVLSLEEKLNGIDLANQAPQAALGNQGYLDWLQQAHELGMQGEEAIVWARTRSFIDPATGTWNAPGLGNNVGSIFDDQERRSKAILRAIAVYDQSNIVPIASAPPLNPARTLPVLQGTASQAPSPVAAPVLDPYPTTTQGKPEEIAAIAKASAEEVDIPGSRAFGNQPNTTVPVKTLPQAPSEQGFRGFAPGLNSPNSPAQATQQATASPANGSPETVPEQLDTADLIIFQDLE